MALKTTIDQKVGNVDRWIPTAYDKVKLVADNIDYVITVADWITGGTMADVLAAVPLVEADRIAAQAAAAAAAADAATVASYYDQFNDIYLGTFATAPVLDNDGNPLQEGALYFDSVVHQLYVYNGSIWIVSTGSGGGTASSIIAYTIGSPTYTSVQDNLNIFHSTGITTGWVISDAGGGFIDVSAGSGFIKQYATDTDILYSLDVGAAASLGLTTGVVNYVYVEYNAGSPQIVVDTTKRTDLHTNVFLGNVYKYASGELHINTYRGYNVGNHAANMISRLQATAPMAHESGAIITPTGTRNFAVSAGYFWEGFNRFSTNAFDSSVADTFRYFYQDGVGGWTEVLGQTQIDNLQYDDASGTLATLGNNRYGVHWVYEATDSHIYVVYGTGNYLLADAQDAQPGGAPPHIEAHGRLIGKIIVQKSATSFYDTQSAFDITFSSPGVTDHQYLTSIGTYTHAQIDAHIDDVLVAHPWIVGAIADDIYFPAGNNIGLDTAPHTGLTTASVWQRMGPHSYLAADSTAAAAGAFGWLGMYFNAYYDTTYKYIVTGAASYLEHYNGEIRHFNAVSGTADTAISFVNSFKTNSSGQGLFAGGSSSLPSMSFINDPDTGIYSNTTNTLQFTTGGTTRFAINSVGLYGSNANSPYVLNTNASSTVPTLIPNRTATTTGIGAYTTGQLSFIIGGVEAMRIDQRGNVGIDATPVEFTDLAVGFMLGGNAVMTGQTGIATGGWLELMQNAYYDRVSFTYKYISTDVATKYTNGYGAHAWYVAASGTAATNISFVEGLRIYNDATVAVQLGAAGSDSSPHFFISNSSTGMSRDTDGDLKLFSTQAVKTQVPVKILELASAVTDTAGYGQIWVKNDTPNTLWFTDDAGTDFQIGGAGLVLGAWVTSGTDMFVIDTGISDIYMWTTATDAAPSGVNLHAVGGSGTDIAGGDLAIVGGIGTGTGAGGKILFSVAKASGTTGSTPNATQTALTISSNRVLMLQNSPTELAWGTNYRPIQFGTDTNIFDFGNNGHLELCSGVYFGSSWRHSSTRATARIALDNTGNIVFYTGASGTIDTVASMPEKFRVANDGEVRVDANGYFRIGERGANATPTASYGEIWVKNDAPNTLWFTDDTGVDYPIAGGGASGYWSQVTNDIYYGTGNVSVGKTTFESWDANYSAIQVGGLGALWSLTAETAGALHAMSQNVYWTGTNYYYTASDEASIYYQQNGTHVFQIASLGTLDTVITWSTAMQINNSGQVLITAGNQTTPALAYTGDPDTGFYNYTANQMAVTLGGAYKWLWAGDYLKGAASYGASLRSAAGAAANPALTFVGDEDTGVTRVSANVLSLITLGTERLRAGAGGGIFIQEIAAEEIDVAGWGQIWVKNDTPNTLWFTDDAGNNWQIGVGDSLDGVTVLSNSLTPTSAIEIGLSTLAADGDQSLAIGYGPIAKEQYNIAIGYQATAGQTSGAIVELDAIAIGRYAIAYEEKSVAIGYNAVTGKNLTSADPYSIAIGQNALANSNVSISIGSNSTARASSAIALGSSAWAYESLDIAIGGSAQAGQTAGGTAETNAIAVGSSSKAYQTASIAIGGSAVAGKNGTSIDPYSIAIGYLTDATDAYSIAIAYGAQAVADYAMAIGRDASANENYNIAIGDTSTSGQTIGGTTEQNAIAIGHLSKAYETDGVSIGFGAVTGKSGFSASPQAIAIGSNSTADGSGSTAVGYYSGARALFTLGLGYSGVAKEAYCIGILGTAGQTIGATTEQGAIAIGYGSHAYETGGIAIGRTAQSGQSTTSVDPYAIAIGYGVIADQDSATSIGYLSDARGTYASAYGYNAQALEGYCTALGQGSQAGQAVGGVTETNAVAIGNAKAYETNTVAIGNLAQAGNIGATLDPNGTAVGYAAKAYGSNASAFGDSSTARGGWSVAIGGADAKELYNIAIGYTSQTGQANDASNEQYAIAIGNSAKAYETSTIAIGSAAIAGKSATSLDPFAMAIGANAIANADYALALGYLSEAHGSSSVAIGHLADARESGGIAIGNGARTGTTDEATSAINSIAIGQSAIADLDGTIVLGAGATVLSANTMVIGGNTKHIVDIYVGKGETNGTSISVPTIQTTGVIGTDVTGVDFNVAGGKSTGTGIGGDVVIKTSPAGTTGSTLNSLVNVAKFTGQGGVLVNEIAAAGTDEAGYGQFWVKNDAPNIPMFTDDTGVDYPLLGVVQVVNTTDGAVATGTTTIPYDDTIPQNTEGDQYMTLAITPKATTNKLIIDVVVYVSNSSAGQYTAALFQDSTAGALAIGDTYQSNAQGLSVLVFRHYMTAGTTSATTFKVRAGCNVAGTTTFNGSGGARKFGGVFSSSITITEVKA